MSQIACKRLLQMAVAGGVLFGAAGAHAHYPWLMASSFAPPEGRQATAYIAWGHAFPFESFMAADRIESVEIVSPDGKRTALSVNGTPGHETPELEGGTYVLLASQQGGFYTRTRQGSKRQSKEGLSGVIKCSFSSNNMKAVLNVGGKSGGDALGGSYDQALEIVPLKDPSTLGVGDYMDVRITLRGEPYGGMVYATYAGFSTEGAYAYTVEPRDDGTASIRILHPGQWLVRAKVEQPYPDPSVCDVESYTTTLTFGIR